MFWENFIVITFTEYYKMLVLFVVGDTLKKDLKIFLLYVWVFSCMYLCTTCMQYPWGPEEGIKSPGTGVADGCEPLCGCSELNSSACKSSQYSWWALSPATFFTLNVWPFIYFPDWKAAQLHTPVVPVLKRQHRRITVLIVNSRPAWATWDSHRT